MRKSQSFKIKLRMPTNGCLQGDVWGSEGVWPLSLPIGATWYSSTKHWGELLLLIKNLFSAPLYNYIIRKWYNVISWTFFLYPFSQWMCTSIMNIEDLSRIFRWEILQNRWLLNASLPHCTQHEWTLPVWFARVSDFRLFIMKNLTGKAGTSWNSKFAKAWGASAGFRGKKKIMDEFRWSGSNVTRGQAEAAAVRTNLNCRRLTLKPSVCVCLPGAGVRFRQRSC